MKKGLFVLVVLLAIIYSCKKNIIQLVEEETGRDFKINGEINLAQSLIPTLIISDASFGNPAWASSKHMVKVDQLEVQVALLPLLTRHVSVNKIILNSPQIFLETDKSGNHNWLFQQEKGNFPEKQRRKHTNS